MVAILVAGSVVVIGELLEQDWWRAALWACILVILGLLQLRSRREPEGPPGT